LRQALRDVYAATLASLDDHLRAEVPRCASLPEEQLARAEQVLLVAFGKASRRMAELALPVLPDAKVRGLLVPPERDDAALPPLDVIPGGHPLPSEGSFAAARRALELCRGVGPDDLVLFLVSGGGSAMFELPLFERATVNEWRHFNRALVASGASIERVNAVRMRLSAVKGGRLAAAAANARARRTLTVVDVPGDLAVASGPTRFFDDASDLREGLAELGVADALPRWLREHVDAGLVPPLPTGSDERHGDDRSFRVLGEEHAAAAAIRHLRARGFAVDDELPDVDDLPVDAAVDELLRALDALRARHPGEPVAVVTTGELSVPLPQEHGVGGRNQQFALQCALRVAGRAITALSCGTDGIDGNSPAAGAVVDGTTVARAAAAGLDVADHLRRFDAFALFDALGDAVVIGPTGTNVRDLRVLVHTNAADA